jgi:hypothetical protein
MIRSRAQWQDFLVKVEPLCSSTGNSWQHINCGWNSLVKNHKHQPSGQRQYQGVSRFILLKIGKCIHLNDYKDWIVCQSNIRVNMYHFTMKFSQALSCVKMERLSNKTSLHLFIIKASNLIYNFPSRLSNTTSLHLFIIKACDLIYPFPPTSQSSNSSSPYPFRMSYFSEHILLWMEQINAEPSMRWLLTKGRTLFKKKSKSLTSFQFQMLISVPQCTKLHYEMDIV